jgi:hypothetical protein
MKNQPLLIADRGGLAQRIDYTRYESYFATKVLYVLKFNPLFLVSFLETK